MSNRLPRGLALYRPDFYGWSFMQVSGVVTLGFVISEHFGVVSFRG